LRCDESVLLNVEVIAGFVGHGIES
jgi:hypothetical protein